MSNTFGLPAIVGPKPWLQWTSLRMADVQRKIFSSRYDPARFSTLRRLQLCRQVDSDFAGSTDVSAIERIDLCLAVIQYFARQGFRAKLKDVEYFEECNSDQGCFRFWDVVVEIS